MKKNKVLGNTLYCIKYIWQIDAKYILLMIAISVLTSVLNVVNLSILRYITDTLMKQEMKYFLVIIGFMLLLAVNMYGKICIMVLLVLWSRMPTVVDLINYQNTDLLACL